MWPKLRDPLMLLALSLLVLSAMFYSMPEPEPDDAPTAREMAEQRRLNVAYGNRHREDAVRLMTEGEYEDALARLQQAAKFDPKGDKSPEVRQMRDALLVDLGYVQEDPQWTPPAPSSAPSSSSSSVPRAPQATPSSSPSSSHAR